METNQAIEILVQVANLAQKGGLLQLQDAIEVLTPKEEENSEVS